MGFVKCAEDDYEILLDRLSMSGSIDTSVPIVAGKVTGEKEIESKDVVVHELSSGSAGRQ